MLRSSRRWLTASRLDSQCHWRIARRGIATNPAASGDATNLPLAGIKVLDMTRVLAGVSETLTDGMVVADFYDSHIVLKYWEISGTRQATRYGPTFEVGDVKKLY